MSVSIPHGWYISHFLFITVSGILAVRTSIVCGFLFFFPLLFRVHLHFHNVAQQINEIIRLNSIVVWCWAAHVQTLIRACTRNAHTPLTTSKMPINWMENYYCYKIRNSHLSKYEPTTMCSERIYRRNWEWKRERVCQREKKSESESRTGIGREQESVWVRVTETLLDETWIATHLSFPACE